MYLSRYISRITYRNFSNLVIIVGAALLSFAVGSYLYTYWLQSRLNQAWQSSHPEELSEIANSARPKQPLPYTPQVGAMIGQLEIPKIDLQNIIMEGVDKSSLKKGPGHYPGSALPGQLGNCVIAAHRDTFFRNIGTLAISDPITISSGGLKFTYVVTSK